MMNNTVIILLLILMIIIALNYKKFSYHKLYKNFLKQIKKIIDEQIENKNHKNDKIYKKDKKNKDKKNSHKRKSKHLTSDNITIENISIDNITEEGLNFIKDKEGDSFLSDISSIDINSIDNSNNTNATPLSFD